ncbi:class F sortase [Sinobaca sp. H24]|uniref:class F sortase n=1 Tax=Sinobaca sp. H24 TaxID=2923376 RepID=UPI00207A0BA3|nr:class F sortase [Sinobaca sp. H24]
MPRMDKRKKTKKREWLMGAVMLLLLGVAGYSGFQVFVDTPSMTEEEVPASASTPSIEPQASPVSEEIEEEFASVGDETEAVAAEAGDTEAERPDPVSLAVPAIDITADLEPVGVLENGQMGVPSTENGVAWFEPGVSPGEQGNAVLAGHVDSKTGPAIFYDLEELEAGDEIEVTDDEGETLTFVVQRAESYDRKDAPLEEIFGASNTRNLNLITCTGTFDQAEGTHDERLVVYTELQDEDRQAIESGGEPPEAPTAVEKTASHVSFHAVRNEDDIAGYRVYQTDEAGNTEQVASIGDHERKSYSAPDLADHSYYVTTVDQYGQESEPSESTD